MNMVQYSEDGNWWWDGEKWMPVTQQQSIDAVQTSPSVATNITDKIRSISTQFSSSNKIAETTNTPSIMVAESGKKKLVLHLLTQNGKRVLEFTPTTLGAGYNFTIDDNKPVLVTGKLGALSKNTKGNGLKGFVTKTSHYLGAELQSCELVFHYKNGLMSNSIKKVEINSSTGFRFSHDV